MANDATSTKEAETQIRAIVENWAKAVRNRDMDTILAHHAEDIVMYDVPKPFQSVGLDAYRKTWDTFFRHTKPGVFDTIDLKVIAGDTIAFCFGTMKCANKSDSVAYVDLEFRLTVGLKKINHQWMIIHEHHSIPSE